MAPCSTLPDFQLDGYKIGTDTDNIALDLGAGATWDDARILHPCAVEHDGTIYLFYTGYDGSVYKIGVASAAVSGFTGVNFTKFGSNPILSGTSSTWDQDGVLDPWVIYDADEELWKMWYRGVNGSTMRIGYATASDPTGAWTKYASNPVISPGQTWEASITMLPNVLKTNETSSENFDTTNLISWWEMEDTSGIRQDSHSSNHLSANVVSGSGNRTGKVGNAFDLVFDSVNPNYLAVASNATLQTGDIDFSIAGWFLSDGAVSGNRFIIAKDNDTSAREWRLDFNDGTLRFFVFDGSGNVVGQANWSSSISADTWYFVVAWHDATGNLVGISVNDGTPVTSATTGAPAVHSGTPVTFGRYGTAMDGAVDEWLFAKRVLTSGERTWLYNSGNGRGYADVDVAKPYKMLYTGNEPASNNGRVGLAVSRNGIDWLREVTNPVLDPGGSSEFDDVSVFSPRTLMFDDGTYHLYYAGKETAAGVSNIGYASSTDLINWTRGGNNPILTATRVWEDDGTLPPGEVENPNAILIGTDYFVFYDAFFGDPATIGVVQVPCDVNEYQPRGGVASGSVFMV